MAKFETENPVAIPTELYEKNCSGLTVDEAIKELRRVEAEEKCGRWNTAVEIQLYHRANFLRGYIIDKIEGERNE